MQHPDEGTIHAWLDGALDAPDARELEVHVATCRECQAMVAEARGLIAAASRIVGQLDGVPSGVLPTASLSSTDSARDALAVEASATEASAVTSTTSGPLQPRASQGARWRYVGLAAAAALGITTTTWLARDRSSVRDANVQLSREQVATPSRDEPQSSPLRSAPPEAKPFVADAKTNADTITVANAVARVAAARKVAAPAASADSRLVRSEASNVAAAAVPAPAPARALASTEATKATASGSVSTASSLPTPPPTSASALPAPRPAPLIAPLAAAQMPPALPSASPSRPPSPSPSAPPPPMSPMRDQLRLRTSADERVGASSSNYDASMPGCYRLVPTAQSSGAAASAKSAATLLLRLTDSTATTLPTAASRGSESHDAASTAFVAHLAGFGAAPTMRWSALAGGLVRLDRDGGAPLIVRLAADTTRMAGRVDRVDYVAQRTTCP